MLDSTLTRKQRIEYVQKQSEQCCYDILRNAMSFSLIGDKIHYARKADEWEDKNMHFDIICALSSGKFARIDVKSTYDDNRKAERTNYCISATAFEYVKNLQDENSKKEYFYALEQYDSNQMPTKKFYLIHACKFIDYVLKNKIKPKEFENRNVYLLRYDYIPKLDPLILESEID